MVTKTKLPENEAAQIDNPVKIKNAIFTKFNLFLIVCLPLIFGIVIQKILLTDSTTVDGKQNDSSIFEFSSKWQDYIAKLPISKSNQDKIMGLGMKISSTYDTSSSLLSSYEEDDISLGFFESLPAIKHLFEITDLAIENKPEISKSFFELSNLKEIESSEFLEKLLFFVELCEMAYDDDDDISLSSFLEQTSYQELFHQSYVSIEEPAFFVAFDPKEKTVIIGVKGTSTIQDAITDVLCSSESFLNGKHYTHSGIKNAAYYIINRIKVIINTLFIPLGYKIITLGHSLGAGTAALVAVILKEELKVKVDVIGYCIAPPPVLDKVLALKVDYIISVVNDKDIIPRCSLSNFRIARKLISMVKNKLDSNEKVGTEEMIQNIIKHTKNYRLEYQHDLYIPGRVILMYQGELYTKKKKQKTSLRIIETNGANIMLLIPAFSKSVLVDHLCHSYVEALKKSITNKFGEHFSDSVDKNNVSYLHVSIDEWHELEINEKDKIKKVLFYKIETTVFLVKKKENAPVTRYTVWKSNHNFVEFEVAISKEKEIGTVPSLPSFFETDLLNSIPEDLSLRYTLYLSALAKKMNRVKNSNVKQMILDFLGAGTGYIPVKEINDQISKIDN